MPLKRCVALSAEERADEHRHVAAVRQQLDDLAAERAAGFVVVGADVEQALRLRRVGIERDEWRLRGDAVEHRHLIVRRDGADRDGVVALTREVLEDLVLLLGRAVRAASSTSTWTLPSASYLRTPAAAIFQNSLALLVTNASLTAGVELVPPLKSRPFAAATARKTKSHESALRPDRHALFIDGPFNS